MAAGLSAEGGIATRVASRNDVDNVVIIHQQAFSGFFLAELGTRFLKLYYSTVLEVRGGILLIAEGPENEALGFVAGFTDTGDFYKRLKRKRISIAYAVMLPVLRSPKLIKRLLSSASLAGERIEAAEHTAMAELSSIAVADAGKGAGVGRLLLDEFCAEAAERGVNVVVLTTDAVNNDSVNAFYTKSGFRVTREFVTAAGRTMNEYQIELDNPRSAAQ